MLLILLFFVVGILSGRVSRNRPWVKRYSEHFSFAAVLFLLFILGYHAGNNPKITAHFDIIGLHGILIGIFATLGSVVFIWLFVKRFANKS